MKRTNMAGFLCKSPAATAVCTTIDPRSAIVPRRPQRSSVDHAMLMDMKYSRLVESRRFALAEKRSKAMSAARRECRNPHNTSNVSSLSTSDHVFQVMDPSNSKQVVVMRVSLHCQGCAGKVKKHLSKMEGVTSFSIDLESKRVTVMGHVSPVGVLESISKVKKAEFWSSK